MEKDVRGGFTVARREGNERAEEDNWGKRNNEDLRGIYLLHKKSVLQQASVITNIGLLTNCSTSVP